MRDNSRAKVMMRHLLIAAMALCLGAGALQGQDPAWDPTGLQLSRAELQEMLARYEETAAGGTYSRGMRERARSEAALIRQRLAEGDVRVGDRIILMVEGHQELTDTFNVVAGRRIVLPDVGEVPLEGVLNSELEAHMRQHIARFLRDPVVRTRSLIRLEIMGAVGAPGFYMVPADMLLTDALMIAGGPTPRAELSKIRIERGEQTLWSDEALREAVIEGRTLDQLSVRAGDAVEVPEKTSVLERLRDIGVVVSGLSAVGYLLVRAGVF